MEKEIKVSKLCPVCKWRIFDKVTPTTGVIQLKCPNCHRIVTINLAFRKRVFYRRAKNTII